MGSEPRRSRQSPAGGFRAAVCAAASLPRTLRGGSGARLGIGPAEAMDDGARAGAAAGTAAGVLGSEQVSAAGGAGGASRKRAGIPPRRESDRGGAAVHDVGGGRLGRYASAAAARNLEEPFHRCLLGWRRKSGRTLRSISRCAVDSQRNLEARVQRVPGPGDYAYLRQRVQLRVTHPAPPISTPADPSVVEQLIQAHARL